MKTTGSKGFHVVVPLDGKTDSGQVASFAHAVGTILIERDPQHLTQEFHKADRGGRIFVDTGRNGYSATFAAAYAVRAKRGAPVSAPCTWQELERGEGRTEDVHAAHDGRPHRRRRRPVGGDAQARALPDLSASKRLAHSPDAFALHECRDRGRVVGCGDADPERLHGCTV